ncbi:MAG: hypothetical protein JSW00_10680 [Thermoplasmata archaeon]|nr:MAG: hypothetical protein JSW00_10680 [Thermoplasmata archaeon]
MDISTNEILNKLEGYEFRKSVQKWIKQLKETPYLSEILGYMMKRYFDVKVEERWVTIYKLLKETGIRGKESFYRKSIPNLIELGVLDYKEVKITPYSQFRRYVKLNDDFIDNVIYGIASFKEKTEKI